MPSMRPNAGVACRATCLLNRISAHLAAAAYARCASRSRTYQPAARLFNGPDLRSLAPGTLFQQPCGEPLNILMRRDFVICVRWQRPACVRRPEIMPARIPPRA